MFKPIATPEALPAVGARAEDLNLDFKVSVKSASRYELAKDMAAFANASGGVILVGAAEEKNSNTLSKWIYLTKDDALTAQREYQQAANTLLSPKITLDSQAIEVAPGSYAVAVSVWPSALLPIAVEVPVDTTQGAKDWTAWAYFMRVGTHNLPLSPEQAAMLMIPQIRHSVTLLNSIPIEGRGEMIARFSENSGVMTLTDVSPLENSASFRLVSLDGFLSIDPDVIIRIPLNDILSVWKSANRQWSISIKGELEFAATLGYFVYNPNRGSSPAYLA